MTTEPIPARPWRTRFASLLAGLVLVLACQANNPIETGGETHFLKTCSGEADDCGGLSCMCGVCTVLCDDNTACSNFADAVCVSPGEHGTCSSVERRCDVECHNDDDCASVSPFHVCDDGTCRTQSPKPETETPALEAGVSSSVESTSSLAISTSAGTPSVSQDNTPPEPDAAPGTTCESGTTSPNEILIIGDSFFAKTHQITAYLEDLSRTQGTLPEGERYRDSSRTVGNTLAVGGNGIADQYAAAVADGAVSVVIMNGGGADALLAQCDPIDSNCPELVNAAMAAESLLATMATDGVTDVVYAYYPATTDEALSAKLDALQPLIESACSNAALDCHWIDLEDTFSGNAATYLAADGSLPTSAGSEASAREIWRVMQSDCIGQ